MNEPVSTWAAAFDAEIDALPKQAVKEPLVICGRCGRKIRDAATPPDDSPSMCRYCAAAGSARPAS